MKKILTVLSLVAIMGCSLPASARDFHGGNFDRGYNEPPRHERVVVNKYYGHDNYRREPVREVHYVRHSNTAGAVVGGVVAGAVIGGLIAAIVD